MMQWPTVILLTVFLLISNSGCGPSGTSLTAEQLKEKYPDKKYVQVGEVWLHYEQEGLGKPAVFLHGLPTDSSIWRNIVPGLTYGNTIYCLDLMGSGFSEKPQNKTYSIDTQVELLGKFLDGFHLENPVIGGHGVGAAIAAVYAVRNPHKVRKLILMDAPLFPGYSTPGLGLLRFPLIGGMLTNDWFLTRTLRGGVKDPKAMPDVLVATYLAPYKEDPGARVALLKQVKEFNLDPILEKEVIPSLAKLQFPILVVWGDGDPYVPLSIGRKIDDAMPDNQFRVILRTGFYNIEERPEEVRAVVKEFMDQD